MCWSQKPSMVLNRTTEFSTAVCRIILFSICCTLALLCTEAGSNMKDSPCYDQKWQPPTHTSHGFSAVACLFMIWSYFASRWPKPKLYKAGYRPEDNNATDNWRDRSWLPDCAWTAMLQLVAIIEVHTTFYFTQHDTLQCFKFPTCPKYPTPRMTSMTLYNINSQPAQSIQHREWNWTTSSWVAYDRLL